MTKRAWRGVAAIMRALMFSQGPTALAQTAANPHKPVDILLHRKVPADDGTPLALTV